MRQHSLDNCLRKRRQSECCSNGRVDRRVWANFEPGTKMLSFADVVRNQPNKYIKSSASAETREESVDHGFYECNFDTDSQDAEEVWDRSEESNGKDQPYDCYVGAVPSPKPRVPARVGIVDAAGHSPEKEDEFRRKANICGSPERNAPRNPPPVEEAFGANTGGQSAERFLIVKTRLAKYMKCIELVKTSPARSNVLIIVNGDEADTSLMIALLCLSDISAGPAGQTGVTVQVVSRNDLKKVKGTIDMIINFEMVSSLSELAKRGAALRRHDGNMKSLILESSDERAAQEFVSQLFRYGLALPFELERYLV